MKSSCMTVVKSAFFFLNLLAGSKFCNFYLKASKRILVFVCPSDSSFKRPFQGESVLLPPCPGHGPPAPPACLPVEAESAPEGRRAVTTETVMSLPRALIGHHPSKLKARPGENHSAPAPMSPVSGSSQVSRGHRALRAGLLELLCWGRTQPPVHRAPAPHAARDGCPFVSRAPQQEAALCSRQFTPVFAPELKKSPV